MARRLVAGAENLIDPTQLRGNFFGAVKVFNERGRAISPVTGRPVRNKSPAAYSPATLNP